MVGQLLLINIMKQKLNISESFKLLSMLDRVYVESWDMNRKIFKLIVENKKIDIIKKKWEQSSYSWENGDNFDIKNENIWCTTDNGSHFKFWIDNGKLICNVEIFTNSYEYSSYSGRHEHFLKKKFTCSLVLPNKFILEIESYILYALKDFAKNSYENYLESQKALWINNFMSDILDNIKKK